MLKNSLRFIILNLIISAAIIAGCEKETVQPPGFAGGDVSFTDDVIPLFQSAGCTDCHAGGVSPDLRADKAYNALIDGDYVVPGEPENSELIDQLKNAGSHKNYLTPAELGMLEAWIEQGAENN